MPTGCHAPDQMILLADGTAKAAADIRLGDRLMGDDGTPREVLALHSGVAPMCRVTPIKGEPFIVTEDHILPLVQTNTNSNPVYASEARGGTIDYVKTGDYASRSKTYKHIHKLYRSKEIERFDGNDGSGCSIDPHFLGVLLGDGDLRHLNITTMDKEIVEEIEAFAVENGMTIRTENAGQAKMYFLKTDEKGRNGSVFRKRLQTMGVSNKHSRDKFIPAAYRTAPAWIRLEILAGLIDTDGHLTCNGYDFITASRRLADDMAFICRSLGLAAYVSDSVKRIKSSGFEGKYYKVSVSGDCSRIPVRVKRKKSDPRKQKKDVLRTGIKKIEFIGKGNFNGFTVDGNNLYLLSDFTVTHNCGKTVVFSKIASDCVSNGDRVLILAHRGELLEQAADKLQKATGLVASTEKAEQTCLDAESRWYRVTVGSVQTLQSPKRLASFDKEYFKTIIIDEAHHALSDSYRRIIDYFGGAKLLGVTATPDRGDQRGLGEVFETLAYEYSMVDAIRQGYLCPIKVQMIPLKIDLGCLTTQAGDYTAASASEAVEPYLEAIAKEMETACAGRKTVVFLPLVSTSKKMQAILERHGFAAAEVNGQSEDRKEILRDFEAGKHNVLCNSMLLTEGWDCPSVDCIIVLRPTKSRGLYSQMIGRGTRLSPGKQNLLVLDFLWLTERHDLCRPADLIGKSEDVRKAINEMLGENPNGGGDLLELLSDGENKAAADREAALAKKLEEMRKRKRQYVDPLQYAASIQDADLINYEPVLGWEKKPVTQMQRQQLEQLGLYADEIDSADYAEKLIEAAAERKRQGLATAKQIRFLEARGFKHVGQWTQREASNMISRISFAGWRIPKEIDPSTYTPAGTGAPQGEAWTF